MELYQEDLRELKAKLIETLATKDQVYSYALEIFRHTYYQITQYRPNWNEERILSDFYAIGREVGLQLFYQEFVSDFWSRYHYDYSKMYTGKKRRNRYLALPTKYVKKPHHEKHNKEKDAWRIEQRIDRDKSRKQGHRRGPASYYKKLAAQLSRRRCFLLLKHEKWDDLDPNEKSGYFVDPWDWD